MKCRESWKCLNNNNFHFPFWFPTLKCSIREWEGNKKFNSQCSGTGREWKKNHSQNKGTGRDWKKSIPKFGNGKGIKKGHSRNSRMGREWKNPFPHFGKGNQRPPFMGMTRNGNSRSLLADDSLVQIWRLQFVHNTKFLLTLWAQDLVKILKLKFRHDCEAEVWSEFCCCCLVEVAKLNLCQA